jgi:hypothetical protein
MNDVINKRTAMATLAVAVCHVFGGVALSASAGTGTTRVASISPSPDVYEPITPNLYATGAHENLYIRFDRTPEAFHVRWVKCGYTSTQDAASSVGGNAVYVPKEVDFGGAVGNNFKNGSCVRLWARAAYPLPARTYYPIEAYFAYSYRW